MKIALISSLEPFAEGCDRDIVEGLARPLRAAGHQVETVWLPFFGGADPLDQMWAYRLMDLERSCDRIVCFRPPAHLVPHPRKIVWLIHHPDLPDGPPAMPGPSRADAPASRALRDTIRRLDAQGLSEAGRIFAGSRVVADRLRRCNGVEADTLLPPVQVPERFRGGLYGEEIVALCGAGNHRRRYLLAEAMALTRTPVRLRLCGRVPEGECPAATLRAAGPAAGRVTIEARGIGEEERAALLAGTLAHVHVPPGADGHGRSTLEAAHAAKATVTTADSGGVLEFVRDGVNGLVVPPTAAGLARAFDTLHADRSLARRLGEAARARIAELGIGWRRVVAALTAPLPGEVP